MGKGKLVVLCSTSMVGRIIRRLQERGVLREPIRNHLSAHRRAIKRPYATRKPKGYRVIQPGDLVQLDTIDIRPLPGVVFKQFTARDVVSRWDVLQAHTRATSRITSGFIDDGIIARMPFPVRAIQVDGGSEFRDLFEEECQKRRIKLFVSPPHSPKLNGHVERAQRTLLRNSMRSRIVPPT